MADDIYRVGPKGYIHGWIFVGAPGVGTHVFHPQHGPGIVTAHSGTHASVRFSRSGTTHAFEARPGTGVPRLEPRSSLPQGVTVSPHASGTLHVQGPYDRAFIGALKNMGAHWLPKSKTWSVPGGKEKELHGLIHQTFGETPSVRVSDLPPEVHVGIRGNGKVEVKAPFSDGFRRSARDLGGTWDPSAKAWVFPGHREQQVRAAVSQHYGSAWQVAQRDVRQARSEARTIQHAAGDQRPITGSQRALIRKLMNQVSIDDFFDGTRGPSGTSEAEINRWLAGMSGRDASRLIDDLITERGW